MSAIRIQFQFGIGVNQEYPWVTEPKTLLFRVTDIVMGTHSLD